MNSNDFFKNRGAVDSREGPFAWESYNRNVKWDLASLIEAATHTEDKVKDKILEYASEEVKQRYADSTLDQILSLPPEVQMKDIDYSTDIDKLIDEVKTKLIKSDYVKEGVINSLMEQEDFKELKKEIKAGNPYATPQELIKGMQDLALVKKLGYGKIDIIFKGSKRVDRDLEMTFYGFKGKKGDIRKTPAVTVMDEIKKNTTNFYLGTSGNESYSLLKKLVDDKNSIVKYDNPQKPTKIQIALSTQMAQNAAYYFIVHKYGATQAYNKGKYSDISRLNSNVIFSDTSGTTKLMSQLLTDLQTKLNNSNVTDKEMLDTLTLIFQKVGKADASGHLYYGTMKGGMRSKTQGGNNNGTNN